MRGCARRRVSERNRRKAALSAEINPGRVSCAIEIISFQNSSEVLKTCSACRKDFFDKLSPGPAAAGALRMIWAAKNCSKI